MHYLGIDLGGTNIVAGLVDDKYNIIEKSSCKTNVPRSEDEICDDMVKLIIETLERENLTMDDIPWVGIGAPGSANVERGVIEYSANLYIHNWHLTDMMEKRLKKKVIIENDANAAAFGEYLAGSGKGARTFVAVTLGTGIGGGIIIDGNIYRGSNYNGAEIGHMVIEHNGKQCSCGRKGCWETYASATGLKNLTKDILINYNKNSDTVIWDIIGGNLKNVNGRTAYLAMDRGDKIGKKIVDLYVSYLSCGLVNIINIFQPDVLCIGGGISREGERLLSPIRDYVSRERYSKNSEKQTELCIAELGNDAGVLGAAMLGLTVEH